MRRLPADLKTILDKIGELPDDKQSEGLPANRWNHWKKVAAADDPEWSRMGAEGAAEDARAVRRSQRADCYEAALAAELLARRALVKDAAFSEALLEAAAIVAEKIENGAVSE